VTRGHSREKNGGGAFPEDGGRFWEQMPSPSWVTVLSGEVLILASALFWSFTGDLTLVMRSLAKHPITFNSVFYNYEMGISRSGGACL
jgi:hypothetical protein